MPVWPPLPTPEKRLHLLRPTQDSEPLFPAEALPLVSLTPAQAAVDVPVLPCLCGPFCTCRTLAGCPLWAQLRAGGCPQLTASGFWASLPLPKQALAQARPLYFLPVAVSGPGLPSGPSPVWFSCSVQHQGRLSLDLSHRACSDYSEMRASHGSNSLPSSARLGNCSARVFSPS